MLIKLASDLHLEFQSSSFGKRSLADVLILAGDISNLMQANKNFQFYFYQYETVIYVMGNHEYYGKDLTAIEQFRRQLGDLNVIILDNEFIDIGDTRIIGSTMWTDCDKGNPITMEIIRNEINDFRLIKGFTVQESADLHKKAVAFIDEASKDHEKVIVVTHHAPSHKSVHPRFYGEPVNHAYYSDLDEFIMDRPQIKLWCHGHMHNSSDYLIGDTRVVCNPHGYGIENRNGFNKDLIIEV